MNELDEIREQLALLKAKEQELEAAERKEYLAVAQVFVGKCYRYTGTDCCFKIIDVPQVERTMTSSYFNRYQFPAVFIDKNEEGYPFYKDTVYFNIEMGIPEKNKSSFNSKKVEEITSGEFDYRMDMAYEEWADEIKRR